MKTWSDKLSVQQLKDIAQAANLPVSGSKQKLKERLAACDQTRVLTSDDTIIIDIKRCVNNKDCPKVAFAMNSCSVF